MNKVKDFTPVRKIRPISGAHPSLGNSSGLKEETSQRRNTIKALLGVLIE